MSKGYWVVKLEVFAFESEEGAVKFRDALEAHVFENMSEAADYGGCSRVEFEAE